MNTISKWWDDDNKRNRYVVNVGTRNGAMFRKRRAYFVVLDKNYNQFFSSTAHPDNELFSPTADKRLKMSKKVTANPYDSNDTLDALPVANKYKWSRGFPTTEGGFYVPQEYWDEYGLE